MSILQSVVSRRVCLASIALSWIAFSFHSGVTAATLVPPPVAGELRVATWNIRSGDGRCPIGGVCPFVDSTQNCKDATHPLNAWGVDVPQAELRALARDPTLVAIGIQEGWLGANVMFQQAGSHTLRVQQREDGASVDQILLSPAAYLASAPGPAKHDTTWCRPTETPR